MGHIIYNKTSGEIYSWAHELEAIQQDITPETAVLESDYIENMVSHKVVNEVVTLDPAKQKEMLAEEVCLEREGRLVNEVDPLVGNPLRWDDLTVAKQDEWVTYRTALLDITDQDGFPHNVTWPTKPA